MSFRRFKVKCLFKIHNYLLLKKSKFRFLFVCHSLSFKIIIFVSLLLFTQKISRYNVQHIVQDKLYTLGLDGAHVKKMCVLCFGEPSKLHLQILNGWRVCVVAIVLGKADIQRFLYYLLTKQIDLVKEDNYGRASKAMVVGDFLKYFHALVHAILVYLFF